jgi:CubicO group peptidase (beta-lactamase class C family)
MRRFFTSAMIAIGLAGGLSAAAAAAPCARDARAMPTSPEAIACTFFDSKALAETRALVVLKDGKPVIELYAPGYGPNNRFISWSMAKSITSTLVGQLVGDGALALDAPAPVAAWRERKDDPRAAITLRQLLHMSSGLEHWESSNDMPEDPDTNRLLFGDRARDAVPFIAGKPLAHAPGSTYQYSTATSMLLADIVQRAAAPAATPQARKRAMRDHMVRRLIRPAGLSSLICDFDGAGAMAGGSLCHMTALDWARFGQLYLDGGRVNGVQVVPAAWVDFVRTPAPTDGGYGGHFWLNRPRPDGRDDALFPASGPADAYAAIGHLGQYVVIVPSKRLVVVRLGKTNDGDLAPVRRGLAKLVNAYPDAP